MIPTDEDIAELARMMIAAIDEDGEPIIVGNHIRSRMSAATELSLYLLRAGVTIPAKRG